MKDMTNTTATFSKLSNGSWGIKAPNLVPGETVTVVKRSGETSEAIVGQIVDRKYGNVFATIARPQAVVTAEVTVAARPVADKVTEVGFYLHDGEVYKVVKGKQSGRPYAKKVTSNGFAYDGGAIFKLSASELMTAEEVRVWSRSRGICANCSDDLSDPISVEIGLGTKCGPDILGRETYNAARRAAKLVPWVAEALAKIKAEKAAEKLFVAEAVSFEEAMIESEIEAERRAVEAGMI